MSLKIVAAGLSQTSNSLWAGVHYSTHPAGKLLDNQGLSVRDDLVRVEANQTGEFELLDAGLWELPAGVHHLRISMHESGTAIDALVVRPQPLPPTIDDVVLLQAEDYFARQDSERFGWRIVDEEQGPFGPVSGATGPSDDYLQVVEFESDSPSADPVFPAAEYVVKSPETRVYRVRLRAAAVSPNSDSLWFTIPGAALVDPHDHVIVDGKLLVQTLNLAERGFWWIDAGLWRLTHGEHRLTVSMREPWAAIDALEVSPAIEPIIVDAPTIIQAEDFVATIPDDDHRWFVIDRNELGEGEFTGATGPRRHYLQGLSGRGRFAGELNRWMNRPAVRYEIDVASAGPFDLDLRAAGLSHLADSVWVRILNAPLIDAEGHDASEGSLLVDFNESGVFESVDAGIWSLSEGVHKIEIIVRESGAAVDALTIAPTSILPGDATGDGVVNLLDFQILKQNFAQPGEVSDGDFRRRRRRQSGRLQHPQGELRDAGERSTGFRRRRGD